MGIGRNPNSIPGNARRATGPATPPTILPRVVRQLFLQLYSLRASLEAQEKPCTQD